jgi:ribose/xylose/arabinose/galactoside ABC-type transport system permease subunit
VAPTGIVAFALTFLLVVGEFDLLQVEPVYQSIIEGAIILAAVSADSLSRRAG